ncbi:autotransporter outer membrane beta-barrel domain-containing protein [Enterobacter mori]
MAVQLAFPDTIFSDSGQLLIAERKIQFLIHPVHYTGIEGSMVFDTRLEGDNSVSDRLIIKGHASGNTFVSVLNLGGHGSETLNDNELISVEGNSTARFTQRGRIVAGS